MVQPKYFFSPTLLDCFNNYVGADSIWEKYWGASESEETITPDAFADKCYQELLDHINRKPSEPSYAMACGTALNDVIDSMVQHTPMGRTKTEGVYEAQPMGASQYDVMGNAVTDEKLSYVKAEVDGFQFSFAAPLVENARDYFIGCIPQLLVEANIETKYGVVNLYGFIDELRENKVFDIKTTSKYEFGKYKDYMQRYVYPYCLIESGMISEVKEFEFTAFTLSGGTSRTPLIGGRMNAEVYTYNHEDAKVHITNVCERFIEFIEANRDKITDDRLFTRHSHNH